MKKFSEFVLEKKVSIKDIEKLIKKNGQAMMQNTDGKWFSVNDLDAIDGNTIFGADEDGEEYELDISDISLVENKG